MTFPPGVLVGIEAEFCLPLNARLIMSDTFKVVPDSSILARISAERLEFRHRFPVNLIDVDELAGWLKLLKSAGAFTTRTCGLHVHVSWDDCTMAHKLYRACYDNLPYNPWKERKEYCEKLSWEKTASEQDHFSAFNWRSSNHFEIRIFNGSIKLRGILHPLSLILKEAQRLAGGSQAPVNL